MVDYVSIDEYQPAGGIESPRSEPYLSDKKQLRFIITLGTGTFSSTDNNQITLEGFRATVDIERAGYMQMSEMHARIYGISQSDMNAIATFNWHVSLFLENTIEVFAIDGAVETLVFSGNIINAWADYHGMPDVFLRVQARIGYVAALTPIPPSSYKGAIDVATIMAKLANNLGLNFENNGVSVQLSDVYLSNTAMEQIKDVAHQAGIDFYFDDMTLAICPKNSPRGGLIPEISAQTGLVGYPTFNGYGISLVVIFNPAIVWGGKIKVISDVPQAEGEWFVNGIHHRLESEKPGGSWFSQIEALPNEFAITTR